MAEVRIKPSRTLLQGLEGSNRSTTAMGSAETAGAANGVSGRHMAVGRREASRHGAHAAIAPRIEAVPRTREPSLLLMLAPSPTQYRAQPETRHTLRTSPDGDCGLCCARSPDGDCGNNTNPDKPQDNSSERQIDGTPGPPRPENSGVCGDRGTPPNMEHREGVGG